MLCNGPYTPLKVSHPGRASVRTCAPHHGFLVLATQYSKRHLDRFISFCTAQAGRTLYFMCHPFPPKLPLSVENLVDPHLIHAPAPMAQTASRSVQPFCRPHNCDRPTDRPRYSVDNNRPHLCVSSYVHVSQKCLTFDVL